MFFHRSRASVAPGVSSHHCGSLNQSTSIRLFSHFNRPSTIIPSLQLRASLLGTIAPRRQAPLSYFLQSKGGNIPPHRCASQSSKVPSRVSVYDVLGSRGLTHQMIGSKSDLDTLLSTHPNVAAYAGVDPTASSLHVGHLLPFMALFRYCLLGYPAIALVGTGTARIGDPTGRSNERVPMSKQETDDNAKSLAAQLHQLYKNAQVLAARASSNGGADVRDSNAEGQQPQRDCTIVGPDGPGPFSVLENHVWMEDLSVLAALAELAPAFRINSMLGRDTVKSRLESGAGMSLSEFMYPFLQALDWVRLFHLHGVGIQIGGADQFGNILAGADTLKYVFSMRACKNDLDHVCKGDNPVPASVLPQPFGITVPLLTTASGAKFGKSAGNAIWLDGQLTSPFELYAYFMSTPDAQLEDLFKLFTFVSHSEIYSLLSHIRGDPANNGTSTTSADVVGNVSAVSVRHRLATEVTALVHGLELAERTSQAHRALFGRDQLTVPIIQNIAQQPQHSSQEQHVEYDNSITIDENHPDRTVVTLRASSVLGVPAGKVLKNVGLVGSVSEGRKLVAAGGAYIGVMAPRPDHATDTTTTNRENDQPVRFRNITDATEPITQLTGEGKDLSLFGLDAPDGCEGLKVLVLRSGKKKIKIVRLIDGQ